ncbi:MAG: glycoside hydrolase family 13 protein [Candidatus Obscuribacterales bacterium]|nr:glycoside hydrolase family 13 protein [Candidatus Obscuribacterales bacterium]
MAVLPIRHLAFTALLGLALIFSAPIPVASAESPLGKIDLNEVFHDQGELFCSPLEASAKDSVSIKFRSKRAELDSVGLKYSLSGNGDFKILEMKKLSSGTSSYYDYWQAFLPAAAGKKKYRFILRAGKERAYFNASGFSLSEMDDADFVILTGYHSARWLKDGVIYQIFPDRFFDANPNNNIKTGQYSYAGISTVERAWGESPIPKAAENPAFIFYGGDLEGIHSKLDYIIGKLGADIIYLNPIFESPSNHKYDTSDFNRVARCLGTNEDLIGLSSSLHSGLHGRRAHLLLDGVFNHTGDSHKWFGRFDYGEKQSLAGAYRSKSSPYFQYYSFSSWPKSYASFLNVETLPKLNYGSYALKSELYLKKNSVAQRYLRAPYSIDGWRVDAPQYLDMNGKQGQDQFNHLLWKDFRKHLKAANSESIILGEFWQNASSWLSDGDEWDSVTNFDGFTQPLSQWICGRNYDDKVATLSVCEFDRWLRMCRARYPGLMQQTLSNHLSNHDITRFAQRSGGDSRKTALALYFQMTYPGVPTIYYGDEYGMAGGRDPDDRRTFDWALAEKSSLVELAAKLISIRRSYAALRSGSYLTLKTDDSSKIYSFARWDKKHRIVIVLNADGLAHDCLLPLRKLESANGDLYKNVLDGESYEVKNNSISLRLEPFSGLILVN